MRTGPSKAFLSGAWTSEPAKKSKTNILAINNLAGIWPHTLLFTQLLRQFDQKNTKITNISCGSTLEGICTVMESRNRKAGSSKTTKALDCLDCNFSSNLSNLYLKTAGLTETPPVNLGDFLSEEIERRLEEACIQFDVSVSESLDLSIEGVHFGRVAIYETLLKFKKKDLDFDEAQEKHFRTALRNSIRTFLLANDFLEKHEKFDVAFVFSPQYSSTRAIALAAKAHNLPIRFVDTGANIAERYSSASIWDWDYYALRNPSVENWKPKPLAKLGKEEAARVEAHYRQINNASSVSVYSQKYIQPINIRQIFGINPSSKIVTLALSSTDEVFAATTSRLLPANMFPGQVFSGQTEWVSETINWFKDHRDHSLIIRIHPRDFPNKRDGVKSDQAEFWEALVADLPANVFLNHPNQKIPLRALIENSVCFLTGWSSSALEALELGVPVITYDSTLPGYPKSIHISGESRDQYFENLEKLVSQNLDKSNWQLLVREWQSFLLNQGSIRVAGRGLEEARNNGPMFLSKLLNGLDRLMPYLSRPIELFSKKVYYPDRERFLKFVSEGRKSLFE